MKKISNSSLVRGRMVGGGGGGGGGGWWWMVGRMNGRGTWGV